MRADGGFCSLDNMEANFKQDLYPLPSEDNEESVVNVHCPAAEAGWSRRDARRPAAGRSRRSRDTRT